MILIWRLPAGLSLETVKYRRFPTVTYGRKLCSRAVEVSKATGSGYRFALALAADYCLHCIFRHFHQFLHAAFPRYSFQCEFRNTRMSLCGKMYTRLSIYHTHSGWTPFYFMYDPKCSTTFPWCTINAPAAFAWCTINVPAAFARCTNRVVHKVEFSYIGWNGVHPLWY